MLIVEFMEEVNALFFMCYFTLLSLLLPLSLSPFSLLLLIYSVFTYYRYCSYCLFTHFLFICYYYYYCCHYTSILSNADLLALNIRNINLL